MFKNMLVRFSDSKTNATFEVKYRIRQTAAAQVWARCIVGAQNKGLRERHRFYGFERNEWCQLDSIVLRLETVISDLQKLHPDIKFPSLDLSNLQKSVNILHCEFAHSHHVTQLIKDENVHVWSEFNILLHAIESALYQDVSRAQSDIYRARVVFTWHDNQKLSTPPECYKDYTLTHNFGTAYINYSQVGRQIWEVFSAGDEEFSDEHLHPASFLSADTMLWFGPNKDHAWEKRQMHALKDWFEKNKNRLNDLGFFWGDPKLALGHIPVAQMDETLYTVNEINEFIAHLSGFDFVADVKIEG